VGLAAATLLAAACAPPDTPPSLADRIPSAVTELLHPDTVRSARMGAGVWYRYLWSGEGPWAVHVVEADFARCDLALRILQAQAREGGGEGHEPVTSMVARDTRGILAAVNADFFTPEGRTLGSEVVDGKVTSARSRPALAWRPGREPWVGLAQVAGDSLTTGWSVPLESADDSTEVVGGYPELLDRGRRVGDLGVSERPGFAASRHPRTAVGYDPAARRLWLVVVDGRQPPYSVGMTLPELTALLEAFGAREAINLDGGGSSVMVIGGIPRNRPSEEGGERPVVNALALVRDLSLCRTPPARE
jgi:hypothetical protein